MIKFPIMQQINLQYKSLARTLIKGIMGQIEARPFINWQQAFLLLLILESL